MEIMVFSSNSPEGTLGFVASVRNAFNEKPDTWTIVASRLILSEKMPDRRPALRTRYF